MQITAKKKSYWAFTGFICEDMKLNAANIPAEF